MKCEHKDEWLSNYYATVSCWTPYCGGHEIHCMRCGRFITFCLCGANNGESGWSSQRWLNFWRKRREDRHHRIRGS